MAWTVENYKKALRSFIKDHAQLNRLLNFKEENSDDGLEMYLMMALGTLNSMPPQVSVSYGYENFPIPSLLIHQATLECLISNEILQARNDIDYNNAGISVKADNGQRYNTQIEFLERMMGKELEMFSKLKININVFNGFGGSHSPYVNLPRQRGWSGRIV